MKKLATGGLKPFINRINKYPRLSAAEEVCLIKKWKKSKDPKVQNQIIEANLRHVVGLALALRHYKAPVEDMISEGSMGLIEALKHFDLKKKVRFITYGAYWARQYMQVFVMKWIMAGKTGGYYRAHFWSFGRSRTGSNEERHRAIAAETGLPETKVAQIAIAFSQNVSIEENKEGLGLINMLSEEGGFADKVVLGKERKRIIDRALDYLPDKDREVIHRRFLNGREETLNEAGKAMGLTRERIRQLEVRGKKLLKFNLSRIQNSL